MPFPKDNNHTQKNPRDCFRCAIACLINADSIEDVPFIDPDDTYYDDNYDSWWGFYEEWIRENTGQNTYYVSGEANIDALLNSGEKWIAVVESLVTPSIKHAIVMDGRKLYYDPGHIKRKQKPKKILYGIIIGELADDGKSAEIHSFY